MRSYFSNYEPTHSLTVVVFRTIETRRLAPPLHQNTREGFGTCERGRPTSSNIPLLSAATDSSRSLRGAQGVAPHDPGFLVVTVVNDASPGMDSKVYQVAKPEYLRVHDAYAT